MMINRIMTLLNDRLDDAQQHKDTFNQSAMQPLVFDVLREIKQKNGKIYMRKRRFSRYLFSLFEMSVESRILIKLILH